MGADLLPQTPINHQIFDKEHGYNHPSAIMDPAYERTMLSAPYSVLNCGMDCAYRGA
jgi:hypothetical protein